MKFDLDCRSVARLLSSQAESPLAANERARLRLHFVWCDACREVDQQFDFLRRAMRNLGPEEPPRF